MIKVGDGRPLAIVQETQHHIVVNGREWGALLAGLELLQRRVGQGMRNGGYTAEELAKLEDDLGQMPDTTCDCHNTS